MFEISVNNCMLVLAFTFLKKLGALPVLSIPLIFVRRYKITLFFFWFAMILAGISQKMSVNSGV